MPKYTQLIAAFRKCYLIVMSNGFKLCKAKDKNLFLPKKQNKNTRQVKL